MTTNQQQDLDSHRRGRRSRPALLEVLEAMRAPGVDDRVRLAAQTIYQASIDAPTNVIGASPWERSAERTLQRNGSRPRTLTSTAGELEADHAVTDRPEVLAVR